MGETALNLQQLYTWGTLTAFVCLSACAEDTIDLTPPTSPPPAEQDAEVGPQDSGTDAQPPPMQMLYPDQPLFEETVLPILVRECGAGCHQNPVLLDNNDVPNGNQFEFDPENLEDSITEFLHPSYSDPSNPGESEVITHHIGNPYGEIRNPLDRKSIEDWLSDTLIPKEVGTSPQADSRVSCAHLPRGDGIGPTDWFSEFEQEINPMFVGTAEFPEGYCSGSGCHTIVDAGGSLNLLPGDDSCSARWNFFVSQSFLDLSEPSNSPLLRKPLGEVGIHTHGGRQVFNGQDENYILLRNWISRLVEQ